MLPQSELCLWSPCFLAVDLMQTQEPLVSFVSPLSSCSFALGSPWVQEIAWKGGCPDPSTTGVGTVFQKLSWFNLKPSEGDTQETYGALDLGGASTQITFVPRNETTESSNNTLHFRLYGKNYGVYTHSFLCYGKDQALLQKLSKDLQASVTESRPPSPQLGHQPPASFSLSISVTDLKLVTVLSKSFQAGYLTTSGQPLWIVPSRHHLLCLFTALSPRTWLKSFLWK